MKVLENIIELHDSNISGIEENGKIKSICFSGVYLYAEGKGWMQAAKLILENAIINSIPSMYPVRISDGELEIEHLKYINLLELPFVEKGSCKIYFTFTNGENLNMQGDNPRIELIGQREYVEEIEQP